MDLGAFRVTKEKESITSFPLGKCLYCKYRQYQIYHGIFQLYDDAKVIHIQ